MTETGARILFVSRYPVHTGSGRARVGIFLEPLRRRGVDPRVLVWAPRTRGEVARGAVRLLGAARRVDAVVLQKPVLPDGLLRALRRCVPRLVVDVDDAVWVSGRPATYARRFDHAASRADLVVAGSGYLAAEVTGRVATPVEVLPPAVDLHAYTPGSRPAGPPVLVWTGSGPNLADFGPEVVAALGGAVAAGARLRIVSDRPAPFGVDHELVLWSQRAEIEALAGADVGLMPLRDDPRSRGRCGLKAALYLAAGLPVVASRVGAAAELVGDAGAVVDEGHWSGVLGEIVRRPDRWRRLSSRARGRAEARHDLEMLADRLVTLVLGDGRGR